MLRLWALVAFAFLSSRADGAAYVFTPIADASGGYRNIPPVTAINDGGMVAFMAQRGNEAPGLFVGSGGEPSKITDLGGPIAQFGLSPTINASGVVGFTALLDSGEQRVYTGTPAGPVTVTGTNGPLRGIGVIGAIAADGQVAFAGALDSGPFGIFRASPFGMATIASLPNSPSPTVAQSGGGVIAYQAITITGPAIFTTAAGPGTPIVDLSGPLAFIGDGMSINDAGAVAFAGGLDNGRRGIFLYSGGATTTIADTSSAFLSFEINPSPPTVNVSRPGLNDAGQVAFLARETNGTLGIFTGGDPIADAVIKTGQMLDGFAVTNLGYYGALNNTGQLAFTVRLANGSQGVYVASPIVGPPTWKVDADGDWSQAAHWSGGVPNAPGAAAVFGSAINAPRTVAVDVPVTVGRISFDSDNPYTLGGPDPLTLDATDGDAQIEVVRGSHTITAPISLADRMLITVTSETDNLTLTESLTGAGLTLTKAGAGTLTLSRLHVDGLSITDGVVVLAPNSATNGALMLDFLSLVPEPPAAENINAVPEPSALLLVATSIVTCMGIRRGRKPAVFPIRLF